MTKQDAIDLILKELQRAEQIHPFWPDDKIHQIGIIEEEVGEAMQVAIDLRYTLYSKETGAQMTKDFIKEVVQIGAMALRTLINLDKL